MFGDLYTHTHTVILVFISLFGDLHMHHTQVNMTFIGNRAVIGPAVYISNLDACQWFSNNYSYFSLNTSTVWEFMTMG